VIGDEVLGGKVQDGNSHYFSKYCTRHGIALRRVEVVPDEEPIIIESVTRMSRDYDMVITCGGIGPTHDDITYNSIGKAFGVPLSLEPASLQRMKEFRKDVDWTQDTPQNKARIKMVTLPIDTSRSVVGEQVFFADGTYTPLCIVNGNVHILPGVHRTFCQMLEGYEPVLRSKLAVPAQQVYRIVIETPKPESEVAEYLEGLAERIKAKGVKVGSYPHRGDRPNTVDIVGTEKAFMESIVPEVLANVDGTRKLDA
jgi:molybdenum cofactor synthesis domain-containing protein